MFGWLRTLLGSRQAPPKARVEPYRIQARYDNATTVDENQRHWWAADYLSAKASNNFQVRRTLRMRSRYELASNPYLFGVCNSNADDLINTGPTLQCLGSGARQIEKAWNEWAKEVGLVEKLRTCKLAKSVDGEGFLILKTVPDLEHSVKLYPVDIEADQVTTIAPQNLMQWWVDGVDLHPITERPVRYHILKHHPGDYYFSGFNPLATEKVPARHVIHWFQKFRPGQVRGIPVFTSSLDLFTELRAFRKSTIGAAQIAADHAVLLESQAPADYNQSAAEDDPNAFMRFPMERNGMVQLPWGMIAKQMVHQNPSTTYDMFNKACLGEACRPLRYPLIIALGTAKDFNFSSAKLDIENYREGLEIERVNECETIALEPIFRAWVDEAIMVPGLLPSGINSAADIAHAWHWPGFKPLDPLVDAQADVMRMAAGMDTWQSFWARRGLDWKDVMKRQKEAKDEMDRLELMFGDPIKRTLHERPVEEGLEQAPETDRQSRAATARFIEAYLAERSQFYRSQYEVMSKA